MTESTTHGWTDHNVSDPGITLLEAIAYTVGTLALATAAVALVQRSRTSRRGDDS